MAVHVDLEVQQEMMAEGNGADEAGALNPMEALDALEKRLV
jgi:hypothetical protein